MNWIILLAMIAHIESGGEEYPDEAIGDGGLAHGRFQIRQEYVDDANRILSILAKKGGRDPGEYKKYTLQDAHNPARAGSMVIIVLRHYAKHYGVYGDLVAMARIHNGGPRGHLKESTVKYGEKAKQWLEVNTDIKTQQLGNESLSKVKYNAIDCTWD